MTPEKLIDNLRKRLKRTKVARRLCGKYGEDPDFIDSVLIRFEPLDVSAKTVDGEILLNDKLLDGEVRDCLRYLAHELVHCLQQKHGKVEERKSDNVDYLDDPNEKEAFKAQVDFMETTYTPEEIQTYLDGLMKHHDVRGKERLQKIKELKR
jgi:hypothetical protein